MRALAFGLVPDDVARPDGEPARRARPAALGTHLGTGFLSTPFLLPVLADAGHVDLAYELLLQTTPPSWLAMVERGATTVWEEWEGIDDDGRPPSFAEPLQCFRTGGMTLALVRSSTSAR